MGRLFIREEEEKQRENQNASGRGVEEISHSLLYPGERPLSTEKARFVSAKNTKTSIK
jgi:hypothetical protein